MGRQEAAPAGQGAASAGTGSAGTGSAGTGSASTGTAGPGSASGRPASGVPAVRLTGVRRMYGQLAAVAGVDLEVAEGEFFIMLGPSGSGKTTLLRLIAGFERPDAGTVELAGVDVTREPPYARNVNTVFQDYALFPHMNVLENVEYGLRVAQVPKAERRRRAEAALEMVRLAGLGGRKPVQLSGGQRQRVALARAIVNEPEVLLLDEPLGALDLKLRQEMQVELKRIQREIGISFIYVTHDQEEALTMSDRLAVLAQGKIRQLGSPVDLYERPASEFVAGFIGVSNILEREGRQVMIRPEKVQILLPGENAPPGVHLEEGEVLETIYAGPITRHIVRLTEGGQLAVVLQNHERPTETTDLRHQMVRVSWRLAQAFLIASAEDRGSTDESAHDHKATQS